MYGDTTDKPFKSMIESVKRGTDAAVNTYKQTVYRSHLGTTRAAADNDASISGADASTAKKFKALPETGRTEEDVAREFSQGFYRQNDVVAYTDAQGNTKLALISDSGVFF
jgi:hypothetical protein